MIRGSDLQYRLESKFLSKDTTHIFSGTFVVDSLIEGVLVYASTAEAAAFHFLMGLLQLLRTCPSCYVEIIDQHVKEGVSF